MRSTGPIAYAPWYLTALGATYARIGRLDDAQRCSDDALLLINDAGRRRKPAASPEMWRWRSIRLTSSRRRLISNGRSLLRNSRWPNRSN